MFVGDIAGGLTAFAIASGLLGLSVMTRPAPDPGLPGRFAFEPHVLPAPPPQRTLRDVHPGLKRIEAWISAVGAAAAIGDLDGDGIADDLCLVDPRSDTVSLQTLPVHGTAPGAQTLLYHPGAAEAGHDVAPMGCLLADLDLDGHTDALVYFWGRQPILYRAGPDPSHFAATTPFGTGEHWFTNAAVLTDLDGDGLSDVLFGNYFPTGSGVLDTTGKLPVAMQLSMSRAGNGGVNRLFLNRSDGTAPSFRERADLLPDAAAGWTLALGAADLDGNGAPDIYVANDFGPDRLLLNDGTGRLTPVRGRRGLLDIRSGVVGRDSFKGMGVDFGDLNEDGRSDIAVSNIAEPHALHESHLIFVSTGGGWTGGAVPLKNRAGPLGLARSGWSWDVKFGDFDGDGTLELVQATGFLAGAVNRWPELHELAMGNDSLLPHTGAWPRFGTGDALSGRVHDHFFALGRDGAFHDIGPMIGFGPGTVSRGVALGDVDGDGDLDMVIARQWQDSVLYLNRTASAPSLVLDLRLTNPNGSFRTAIGAEVAVLLPDGRRLTRQVDVSNGHSGANAPAVHLGLGDLPAGQTLEVRIAWRAAGIRHSRTLRLPPGHHRIVLDSADSHGAGAQGG